VSGQDKFNIIAGKRFNQIDDLPTRVTKNIFDTSSLQCTGYCGSSGSLIVHGQFSRLYTNNTSTEPGEKPVACLDEALARYLFLVHNLNRLTLSRPRA
jgi:hypothetical protein